MKKTPEISSPTRSQRFQKLLPFLALLGFCVLLIMLDEYSTQLQQTRHLMWMIYDEPRSIIAVYAYATFILSFFTLVIFCWTAFRSFRPVRILLGFFFILAVFIEYGYYNTFQRFMTSVDFWTAALSPWSLWKEAIGMYFNPQALVVSVIFCLCPDHELEKRSFQPPS